MIRKDELREEYFNWLYGKIKKDQTSEASFRNLLIFLHETDFTYTIPKDANRAEDGKNLRYKFAMGVYNNDIICEILDDRPCSVFEMMVALAIRCENIMDDPKYGDRTGQWFWGMVVNLGLGYMTDLYFNKEIAQQIIDKFLNHEYEPDGKGGLFKIRHCDKDVRKAEIWYQLCWYLDSITQ